MTAFADRIRGVLNAPGPKGPGPRHDSSDGAPAWLTSALSGEHRTRQEGDEDLERSLNGQWRHLGDARCFVVEHRRSPAHTHGDEAVGTMASRLEEGAEAAPLLGLGVKAPLVFFDLETTGLSGGAGTLAFLIGCGWFDRDRWFVTRQYLLARFDDEVPLLAVVASELGRAGALVSFNGKSFDAPLLESRYLYHRVEWAGAGVPHLDMLHVARRFWGGGLPSSEAESLRSRPRSSEALPASGDSLEPRAWGWGPTPERNSTPREAGNCSLIALERRLLGARRHGDVPGFEIPSRYFHFLRTGDARPLRSVFEHNRLDLLSLAGLTSRAVNLVKMGPEHVRHPIEACALGRIYARAGLDAQARAAYERAIDLSRSTAAARGFHVEALRALARAWRRARRNEEAARCWRQILDIRGCPRHVACEASEALAIHHEHRVRDLTAARTFALRSLKQDAHGTCDEAVRRRLARLQTKMARTRPEARTLEFAELEALSPEP